ncbi:right-handed parallel beta-helix repeat-containing protein [Sorangium atrum]|uniref:Right-handed parallel beta-helix repeat-containing protein n=1 Tax=Sorangium atrum TaxID=2995308 RepID=A0ABT5CHS9_9BACT|nr:right-handed parallel beta-helix repeat-containing protein [Sorangium aterium]MDC0685488.1 right-handed parallel beta-helix repeat-containing protein [Sorangium aterium]
MTTLVVMGCGDQADAAAKECAPGEVAREDGACERKPCGPEEITPETGACQPVGLPPDMPCPPGELALETGECQPAGLPPDMPCPPGELALETGECQPAGVPPEACGTAFASDGNSGCKAILPEDECPEGQMAIPGETSCREVAPCGDGPWATIPIETNTKFVDQAYAGGDSDGTMTKPWTTIQEAIDDAVDGAIVAVTDGSYAENVKIQSKAVRLRGRCPGLVEIRGTDPSADAILVDGDAATGTEIRSLAVTGEGAGLRVSGARDVTIEQVWVHDTGDLGIAAKKGTHGQTSMALRGSLVEQSRVAGVLVSGSDATIESTVVRATQPSADGEFGWGIAVQDARGRGARASAVVRACLVEHNHEMGVFVGGSDATIESTVVRATQPRADGPVDCGIGVQDDVDTGERASVTVRASLVEQNHDVGVFVVGSDATIEATVVRATQPRADGAGGWGIGVQVAADTGERASVTVRASLVEQNHDVGVLVGGSDATIEATVVRATQPSADGMGGRGIRVQVDADTRERANVTVRASLVEQNHEVGVFIRGSEATIEATVVRATHPRTDGTGGWGIEVQVDANRRERASVIVRASLVEQNHEMGVFVEGSDATFEAIVVRATQLNADGMAGRGIGVQDDVNTGERARVTVRASLVEQNHEGGVYVEGSDATIEATVVRATQPNVDGTHGWGISVLADGDTGERARVTVRASLVEKNHEGGVVVIDSDATIEATVVRATQPSADGEFGLGIGVQDDVDTGERASVTVRASLVEQNHDVGVFVVGSDATIEATVVRATQPSADGTGGRGINVQDDVDTGERAVVIVRASLIEQNHEMGVFVGGSDATIDATVVRATQPSADGEFGRGIDVQLHPDTGERARVTVRASLVEQNHEGGVVVFGSDATIETTIVRTTKARDDNTFGDGIAIANGTATIQNATITDNARAGVANFGSEVTILATTLACNGIDLNGETIDGSRASFDGSSGWQCTRHSAEDCTETDDHCNAVSGNLEPPPKVEPLPPLPPS